MNQPSRFWDKIADRYASKPVEDEEAYQKKLQVTRDYLRPDMVLLEFGCGTGSTAVTHAPHVKHIQAIDISPKMLEFARGKAETANVTNVTFEQAGIEGFSAPEQAYDMVLGLSILHLVEDRHKVITKVHRLLKPDGLFVSSTICLGDTARLLEIIAPIGKFLGLMPLLRIFTASELKDSLTGGGFTIEHAWQPGKGEAVFIVAKKVA
ncbi:MAG: class I SAM-dependent methyltransferase [Alphaproteobacteria bacterium]